MCLLRSKIYSGSKYFLFSSLFFVFFVSASSKAFVDPILEEELDSYCNELSEVVDDESALKFLEKKQKNKSLPRFFSKQFYCHLSFLKELLENTDEPQNIFQIKRNEWNNLQSSPVQLEGVETYALNHLEMSLHPHPSQSLTGHIGVVKDFLASVTDNNGHAIELGSSYADDLTLVEVPVAFKLVVKSSSENIFKNSWVICNEKWYGEVENIFLQMNIHGAGSSYLYKVKTLAPQAGSSPMSVYFRYCERVSDEDISKIEKLSETPHDIGQTVAFSDVKKVWFLGINNGSSQPKPPFSLSMPFAMKPQFVECETTGKIIRHEGNLFVVVEDNQNGNCGKPRHLDGTRTIHRTKIWGIL